MEDNEMLAILAALANEVRLGLWQTLAPYGADGLPAGILAERLGISAANLSFHVRTMMTAGLLHQRRSHRNLYYAVNRDTTTRLAAALLALSHSAASLLAQGATDDALATAPIAIPPVLAAPGLAPPGSAPATDPLRIDPTHAVPPTPVSFIGAASADPTPPLAC